MLDAGLLPAVDVPEVGLHSAIFILRGTFLTDPVVFANELSAPESNTYDPVITAWLSALKHKLNQDHAGAARIFESIDYQVFKPEVRTVFLVDAAAAQANNGNGVEAARLLDLISDTALSADLLALRQAMRGFLHFKFGDETEAQQLIRSATDAFAAQPALNWFCIEAWGLSWLHLAHLAFKQQHNAHGIESLSRAQQIARHYQLRELLLRTYLDTARVLMQMGKIDEAEAELKDCLALDRFEAVKAEALANLAKIYVLSSRFDLAHTVLSEAETLFDVKNRFPSADRIKLQLLRVELLLAEGDQSGADALLDQLVASEALHALEPQHHILVQSLAGFLHRTGRSDLAYKWLEQAYAMQNSSQLEQRRQKLDWLQHNHRVELDKQARLKLKQETILLRQQSLRAQMNPHFFSNVLNAIQKLVVDGKVTEATGAIHHFYHMQRMLLELSDHEWVSLDSDLNFLKKYLEVNRDFRLGSKLGFEFIIDDDIEGDIMYIPPMIIQPFVENAIEHGIMAALGTGHIRIEILPEGDHHICCIVTDNGVGRQAAQAGRRLQRKQPSRGLEITAQRLAILDTNPVSDAPFEFIDLYDSQNQPAGTQVKIWIPVREQFNIHGFIV